MCEEKTEKAKIYRPADLARILGIRKATVHDWEKKGILPQAKRYGSRFTFWLKADIDAWLEKSGGAA